VDVPVEKLLGPAEEINMTEKIRIADLPEFDIAEYLASEEDVAEYLRQVVEDGDSAELARALGHVARAHGMSQLARDTGLSRESLYKSLSGKRAPSSDTLLKVLRALGLKLSVQPLAHA
jgi:probable addiction module antidote protein